MGIADTIDTVRIGPLCLHALEPDSDAEDAAPEAENVPAASDAAPSFSVARLKDLLDDIGRPLSAPAQAMLRDLERQEAGRGPDMLASFGPMLTQLGSQPQLASLLGIVAQTFSARSTAATPAPLTPAVQQSLAAIGAAVAQQRQQEQQERQKTAHEQQQQQQQQAGEQPSEQRAIAVDHAALEAYAVERCRAKHSHALFRWQHCAPYCPRRTAVI